MAIVQLKKALEIEPENRIVKECTVPAGTKPESPLAQAGLLMAKYAASIGLVCLGLIALHSGRRAVPRRHHLDVHLEHLLRAQAASHTRRMVTSRGCQRARSPAVAVASPRRARRSSRMSPR